MPPKNLEKLTRTRTFEGEEVIVVKPGIALVMYSVADLNVVMTTAADVLEAYLDFVPAGSIVSSYEPPADEFTPDQFVPFDASACRDLLNRLRVGPSSPDVEGEGFELAGTADGQAVDYGASLGAINFAIEEEEEPETSILRLELPWNLLDNMDVVDLVDFLERAARLFPYCSGNAGMSFNYTIGYTTAAREEIQKLLPRFLGFDSAYSSAQLMMRGKSPPAHWLNFLDADLVKALGGEEKLRTELLECEVRSLGSGVIIRGAKYPPIVDVNRQGSDIGQLPTVARAIQPIRFAEGSFAGLEDEDVGLAWLERFDNLSSRDWDNG